MSTVVSEVAGSRSINKDAHGKLTGDRTWIVYDSDGLALTGEDVIATTGIPRAGQSHPDFSDMFASSWRLSLSQDRPHAWNVTWQYSSTIWEGGEESLPDGVTGYNMSVGVSILDVWRSGPSMPASISTPSATTDISGTHVSEGGLPISLASPIATINIRQRVTGLFTGGAYVNNVARRNSGWWQGFAPGSLLFTGLNVNHTRDDINEIDYTLAWDAWYHLRQVPERDGSGNPVIDAGANPELEVYWKQPFRQTVSFSFLPM